MKAKVDKIGINQDSVWWNKGCVVREEKRRSDWCSNGCEIDRGKLGSSDAHATNSLLLLLLLLLFLLQLVFLTIRRASELNKNESLSKPTVECH